MVDTVFANGDRLGGSLIQGGDGRSYVLPKVQMVDASGNLVSGTGGGPVTVADGADVTQGAKADSAATSDTGAFSLVALFKRSLGYLSTLATAALKPTAGTNLSGTATTTSGGFNLAANATRKPGDVQGQNVSTVNIGFNEFGGAAVIGAAGTYTVPPNGTFSITTTNAVNFIAASGTAPVTITSA